MRGHANRGAFALVCLCALGLTAALGGGAPSAGADPACPNEAIRAQQHSTALPDCRAWELVSPADKNGGEVFAEGVNIIASASGDRVSYASKSAFADSVGTGNVGLDTYLGSRSPSGWLTHSITPTPRPDANQVTNGNTWMEVYSEDLSRVFVNAYDLAGATDDTPFRKNLYLEDTATRSLQTLNAFQRPAGEGPFSYLPQEFIATSEFWGASADLEHVAFETEAQLLPADPAIGYPNGARNLYTWDEGTVHLAGILPDGMVPAGGSAVDPRPTEGFRGTMSADGSRQSFVVGGQLYLRIDNNRTAWVSESENEGVDPGQAFFEGMTPDGKNVFFVTDTPLLEADTAPGPDLYRWTDGPDPEHEDNLTLITNTGGAQHAAQSTGGALVGMSDNGEMVYVHESGTDLTLWTDGMTEVVGSAVRPPGFPKQFLTLTATQPGYGRVSPDGAWLAYIQHSEGRDGGPLYLYNHADGTLTCASCSAYGGTAEATVVPLMTTGNRYDYVAARPRFLTDDGKVFFSTETALVPQDTNGVFDVYEFDGQTGELHLISSGTGSEPAMFADASRSGNDVFFVTRQALTGSDPDSVLDLYDARVGGGLPEPPPAPAPCSGESCQDAASPPPGAVTAASALLRGAGNPKPQRRCGHNRRRVTRHGKTKCVKKHHRHQRRGSRAAHRHPGR